MAHECPDCGLTCHCGGDIDDLRLNLDKYVFACTHCPDEEQEPYELDDDYEPETCRYCGKEFEDFSDIGCRFCDQRSPDFGVL